jgi:hypothetical protein
MSFEALFHCGDHLFQLCTLSLDILKKCAGFVLHWLESLGHFHDFTLNGMNLLSELRDVLVTFSSSQLLTVPSTVLALSFLFLWFLEL